MIMNVKLGDVSEIVYVWLTEPTVTTTWLPLSDFFFETFNRN